MSAKTKPVGYQHPSVPWNGLTVTDLFCGAGGSSSGLVAAGYRVVIAANHWALAIESHQVNHPDTDHSQVPTEWERVIHDHLAEHFIKAFDSERDARWLLGKAFGYTECYIVPPTRRLEAIQRIHEALASIPIGGTE